MAKILPLSFLALFLFAMTSQVSGSNAYRVRRSAEPDPSDYALADTTQDGTQNDGDNAEDDDDLEAVKTEDIRVLNQGENFTVSLGQTVRLLCKTSPDKLVKEWTKDGQSYALDGVRTGAPTSVSVENDSLLVHDIKLTDLGTYVCSILGYSTHYIVHTISLKESPKITAIYATDRGLLSEGLSVTITCNATGNPKPTLIWSKEVSVRENQKLTPEMAQFGPNTMTIRNVKTSHAGTYICYATNDVGNGTAARINIKVMGRPRVHVPKNVINSAPNIEAILECTVHEEPPANIHWYKDGKPILDTDPKYVIETSEQNSTLKVKPQTVDEFGVFTCEAENTYGKHEKSINLVQYPLIEALKPANGTTFRWTITSHLPLKQVELQIKEKNEENWRNITLPVPEAMHHIYDIEYALDSQNFRPGNYSAILSANNAAAWNDSQDVQYVELESVPQSIQHASVFLGGDAVRPAAAMFTTFCLYLLTRIF